MVKVKNVTGSTQVYAGQKVENNAEYEIENKELEKWGNDDLSLAHAAELSLLVWDQNGVQASTGADAVAILQATNPRDVVTLHEKNKYTMQAWGAKKSAFTASDRVCQITLSNRQPDNVTFTYDMGASLLEPRIGDYIFQNDFCDRAWITSVDTVNKIVVMDSETVRPPLENGTAIYSQGYYVTTYIPDWFPAMQLWGALLNFEFSNGHNGKNDFVELSVVDANDLFMTDDFCLAVLGVDSATAQVVLPTLGWDNNGEYGHWTKYYDEAWAISLNGKLIMTPDGSPGVMAPYFELRTSVFASKTDNTYYEIFTDYMPTAEI